MPPAAVVVDQVELFRLGVERVLADVDIHVATSTTRAGDALQALRSGVAELFIVGRHTDLKPEQVLREAKRHNSSLKVMFLVSDADLGGVARLLNHGVDGLLLRTVKASELADALERLMKGERIVASALAVGAIGRVGPTLGLTPDEAFNKSGLSPKELEVLAELAAGSTYKEIAEALIVTQATVKTHLVHIYAKLEVKNRQEAVTKALALGLLA
jgi:DNA-binding NarL/FixJ family response regulator